MRDCWWVVVLRLNVFRVVVAGLASVLVTFGGAGGVRGWGWDGSKVVVSAGEAVAVDAAAGLFVGGWPGRECLQAYEAQNAGFSGLREDPARYLTGSVLDTEGIGGDLVAGNTGEAWGRAFFAAANVVFAAKGVVSVAAPRAVVTTGIGPRLAPYTVGAGYDGVLAASTVRIPAGVGSSIANLADDTTRLAPSSAARIGDDVIATADDAFTHGYSYNPRIRARGLQDPVGHNFPYSYDEGILRSTPVRQADGSLLYRVPGSINGKDGFFEIALNPDTGTIFHRTFVGG